MTTENIIKIWKLQKNCNEIPKNQWFDIMSIKITKKDVIQVLKDVKYMDDIIPAANLDEWYELNTWSDLADLMNGYIAKLESDL